MWTSLKVQGVLVNFMKKENFSLLCFPFVKNTIDKGVLLGLLNDRTTYSTLILFLVKSMVIPVVGVVSVSLQNVTVMTIVKFSLISRNYLLLTRKLIWLV